METKTRKVLEHLKNKKQITSWEAIQLFRATRLSAIIFNLRKQHVITDEWQTSEDGKSRYKVYYYGGERNVEE